MLFGRSALAPVSPYHIEGGPPLLMHHDQEDSKPALAEFLKPRGKRSNVQAQARVQGMDESS